MNKYIRTFMLGNDNYCIYMRYNSDLEYTLMAKDIKTKDLEDTITDLLDGDDNLVTVSYREKDYYLPADSYKLIYRCLDGSTATIGETERIAVYYKLENELLLDSHVIANREKEWNS